MRSEIEIRAKLKEITDNLIDNISDYKKTDLSLSRLKITISTIRWCLKEIEYIFPPVKKHYRKEEEKIRKGNRGRKRI